MSAWRHISLWMNQLDDDLVPRSSLQGTLDVDVAIAGAGYTGLWTAYYLKLRAPQLKIAIVEAQTAGFGASGRNGGWLMGNMLGEDRLLAGLSPEQRRASYDLLHDIPDEVARVLDREGIDCDYRKAGVLYTAARYPEQETRLRDYLKHLHSEGLTEDDYRWLSKSELAEQLRIPVRWAPSTPRTAPPSTRPSWSAGWPAPWSARARRSSKKAASPTGRPVCCVPSRAS